MTRRKGVPRPGPIAHKLREIHDRRSAGSARPASPQRMSIDGAQANPGQRAGTPAQIPPRGWLQIVRRAFAGARADDVPVLAGGVAYFAFLALFPALLAALNVYGLVADPSEVGRQVQQATVLLPRSAQMLIADQLATVAAESNRALGFGLAASLGATLWSASGAAMALIRAVNTAYDEKEERGFLKLRGIALALTLGAFVFGVMAVGLLTLAPVVFDAVGLGGIGLILGQVLRWLLLVTLVVALLAVTYRVAPDRDAPKMIWASTGAVVATALWLIASAAFSLYVDNFGRYNKTYGSIAGVIVLMLWLYLTAYLILFGAEINAESERQTERDSTRGPERPLGERHAVAADSVAAPEAGGPLPMALKSPYNQLRRRKTT